jgi:RES domain
MPSAAASLEGAALMPLSPANLPVTPLAWAPCHRLIASRYPTVGLYDDIAHPEDLDVVFAIEALTNPRVRQELGALALVPPADRVSGPGATLIMAAFTHLNPEGSRFSDGSYGVYYAADTLDTAVAEVSHHRARFLARTAEPEIDVDLRWIQADLCQPVHDLRSAPAAGGLSPGQSAEWSAGQTAEWAAVYHPEHYAAGQALGRALRDAGSPALAYDSVRRAGGQCVAVFVARALANARPAGHLSLHWDGQRISHWFEKSEPHALGPRVWR